MDMSAQQLTEMLGSLLSKRAKWEGSNVAGANVAVTPRPGNKGDGFMTVALPNGQAFTVQVEEI